MSETDCDRKARIENLMTRVLAAEQHNRLRVVAGEALHGTNATQIADLQQLVVAMSIVIDDLVERTGDTRPWRAYLVRKLVDGPRK